MTDVTALISAAQGYTNTLVGSAGTAMSSASAAVSAIGYEIPVVVPATLPAAPEIDIYQLAASISGPDPIDYEIPADPQDPPDFIGIPEIITAGAPVFTARAAPIVLPNKPNQLAEFTQTMPAVNTNITFPEPPSELLHSNFEAPTMGSYATPAKPQIMLPAFEGLRPTDNTNAPTNLDTVLANKYAEAAPSFIASINGYVDAMMSTRFPGYASGMTAIETQLDKYLAGGTALNASVEDAIYARAQAKNDVEAKRVQDAAFADAAARGFTIPGGALTSALARARQDAANNNAKQATDIAVAQAEMEQKNLQFAVTTSASLRMAMVNATLSYMQNLGTINGQALDYAKSVVNALVEVYNVAVKAFTAKLEAYKADAQVFEVKLRGALAVIELYKAEIQALEAMVNVDRAKVEVYKARIETLVSLSNIYRAQVEAVQGRVGLEKLKIEVFQGQVQAHSSQVQAKNAEWQGYVASLSGEEAKVKIFAAQAQAYSAEVGGWSAKISGMAEAAKAAAMSNQAYAAQYQAVLSQYQAVVSAHGEKARTQVAVRGQDMQAYQARVQSDVEVARVRQEYYKAEATMAMSNAELTMKGKIAGIGSRSDYGHTIAQLGTANAQIYGQLAGSAMSGMNTLVSSATTA